MRKSRVILILALSLFLSACGGRQYIMPEKEINKIEEQLFLSYNVYWLEMHPVLFMSEGAGVRHDLFLEQPLDDGKKSFSGIKVVEKDGKVRLLVITEADLFSQKCIISSRSGRNFYTIDGKNVFSKDGHLVQKLDWSKIKPLGETGTGVDTWNGVELDSEQDKQIQAILINIGKSLDGQKIPGLFDRVMSRVAKITTDDIILAGATDFSSLFGIFGVRIWSLVEAIVQKADLSLPYYDTALVDRFQLGLALKPIQEKINNIESGKRISPLIQEWEKEMEEYQTRKANYQEDYQKWQEEKIKYNQTD